MDAKYILLIIFSAVVAVFVFLVPVLMQILTPESTPENLKNYFKNKIVLCTIVAAAAGLAIIGVSILIVFLV